MGKRKFQESDNVIEDRKFYHSKTYICKSTLECATKNLCIPCAYKIYPTGVVDANESLIHLRSNVRPEMCPRAGITQYENCIYQHRNRILTIGDGDFSFSLSVARSCRSKSEKINLVATSHETLNSVLKTYQDSKSILSTLGKIPGVIILHEVDATKLRETLPCPIVRGNNALNKFI